MKNLSKNYMYNVLSLFTGVLFPFLVFPYISRILMPEYLGKITFAQSIANYFISLSLLGIPSYGVRELSRVLNEKEEFSKTLTELILISMISSFFSTSIFITIIYFFQKLDDIKILLYIFSLQVFFSFLNLDYLFIVLEKHKRRTTRAIILRAISIICIFYLIKIPSNYILYILILVLPEIFARVIDAILYRKYFYKKIKDLNLKKHTKPLLIIFLYLFSVGIYVNLDITMLGILKTENAVGLYTTGSKIVRMIIPIVSILGIVMAPRINIFIKNKEKEKIYKIIDLFIDFNLIIGIPAVFLLCFLSKEIILLISGVKFVNAIVVMKIMSVIIIFLPIGAFLGGQILIPNNKEKLVFKISIIGMILNIFLNFCLIPKFGIEGAAYATILTEFLIFAYRAYEVKKIYMEYKFITKQRIKYFTLSLVSFCVIYFLKNILHNSNNMNRIFFYVIIFEVIYLLGLLYYKDENIYLILNKFFKNN